MPTIKDATSSPGGNASRRDWRDTLRRRRRAVCTRDARLAANDALGHLQSSRVWQAGHIALYIANDGELDPADIADAARDAGKVLYLPVLFEGGMRFCRWDRDDPLTPNRFGIGEPAGQAVAAERLDLLILPVVGWTSGGFRLGMGGGYYDRFLANDECRHLPRVGLGYESQREDQLEVLQEPWDQPMDGMLTERALHRFDRAEQGILTSS